MPAMIRRYIFIVFIYTASLLIFGFSLPLPIYAISSTPPGLGQCHWIGGPLYSFDSLKWGYSESQPFAFRDGEGDSWAAIEPQKGVYNFSQQRGAVEYLKNKNKTLPLDSQKTIWLDIQVAGQVNKEQNIPKWALDEGLDVYESYCGDSSPTNNQYWASFNMSDVTPVWGNPKYMDVNEAVKYTEDGVEKVKFPVKLPAVWDPKFQDYYLRALAAQKREFQNEIDAGVVTAINLMSGGHFGEHNISAKCPGWAGVACTPDVLNPSCPVIKSMAKFKGKTPEDIAKKSNCNPNNTIPGNTPQVCNQEPCPSEYGSACYVFDDYFIQSIKQLISREAELFNGLPVVWLRGAGLSGTGRTYKVLEDWMSANYGSRIWFKFNGWGPQDKYFYTNTFNRYGQTTRHGFEVGAPWAFNRTFWNTANIYSPNGYITGAQNWCLNSAGDPKPKECLETPLIPDKVARLAIATAVKSSMLDDRSSYLCIMSDFFDSQAVDRGGGKLGNNFYFNPGDNNQNCDNSEINAAAYGVGFCPGYLNYVFSLADNPNPPPPLPTAYPNAPQNTIPNDQSFSCTSCPEDKIPKEKGNSNCDKAINDADYALWKGFFAQNNTQAAAVDFNCASDQSSHTINLVDFEIWRRNAFPKS